MARALRHLHPDPRGDRAVHGRHDGDEPLTRDWSVTASLFATLNDTFGNRTVFGIGRGDSAVRFTGGTPSTLATLESAIDVIKPLGEGRTAVLCDTEVTIPWVRDGRLDVWTAAYRPKALELAGCTADCLIQQLADPFIIEWTINEVHRALDAAGRSREDFTICVAAPAYAGEDLANQRDQVRWFGGVVGNHAADVVTRYGATSAAVPAALTEYMKGCTGYDYRHHGQAGNPDTEFVPDEIIDRFRLLGPVEAHRAKLQQLGNLGVEQFALYLMHDNPGATLEAYGRDLVGRLECEDSVSRHR